MSRYKQAYSLYKRGKYYYFRTYTIDGRRTSGISTGCTSKNAAKQFCEKLYLTGQLLSNNKTFLEYAEHFYDDNSIYVRDRVEPLAANTLNGYRIRMNQTIIPYFKNYKMSDISYTVLKNFRLSLMEKYAVSTISNTMNCLKHIFDYAYRDQIITINPFSYLESLGVQSNIRDAFTLEEVQILYRDIEEEFKETILLLALTGTRISEAVGLRKEDIIRIKECNYIDLKTQVNKKKRIPVKKKSIREIPIIPEIEELIGFDDLRLSAFYRAIGKVKQNFQNVNERNLSFHSLRHFFITNSKAYGIPEIKSEYLAGHKEKGVKGVYTNFKAIDCIEILNWQKETMQKIKEGSHDVRAPEKVY